jgi:hypothetical protein
VKSSKCSSSHLHLVVVVVVVVVATAAAAVHCPYFAFFHTSLVLVVCHDDVYSLHTQMPSLFSRSRTQSSPFNNPSLAVNPHDAAPIDEFGRVHSRSSHSPTSNKKERNRKKDRDQDKTRSRTPGGDYELPTLIPEGSFLPLNLERPRDESGDERPKEHDYGHLSHQRHVVLGLEQAERLVEVVAEELNTRGLTTPFIFSSLALNISTSAIKRLIQTFLHTCENPGSRDAERSWLEEARFANPPELGMFLRWGLARLVRYSGGEDVRGLLLWDQYNSFCETEAGE